MPGMNATVPVEQTWLPGGLCQHLLLGWVSIKHNKQNALFQNLEPLSQSPFSPSNALTKTLKNTTCEMHTAFAVSGFDQVTSRGFKLSPQSQRPELSKLLSFIPAGKAQKILPLSPNNNQNFSFQAQSPKNLEMINDYLPILQLSLSKRIT